ncbi:MAG: AAA family ATPase [Lentisphaeria bacterium]|nr:AAA family ATPase [Lentisphaeria bacterium]
MPEAQTTAGIRVLSEILDWSNDRPMWQRDALRRIVTAGGITEQDLDELEQLCRAAHGMARADTNASQPAPLASMHIGARGAALADPLSLVAIRNLRHVNRIPHDTEITFGPAPGLAVVFGPNGAGKSGYARVLRRLARLAGPHRQSNPTRTCRDLRSPQAPRLLPATA